MARGGSSRTRNFRQRKSIAEDFSIGNPKHKVENAPTGEEQQLLKYRSALQRFSKKIQSLQIDSRGWELLGRTPFGSLIKAIPKLDMNVEMLDVLLCFWDEKHCGFAIGGKTIPFIADDVALITGLPNRGDKVPRKKVAFDGDANYGRSARTLVSLEQSLDKAVQISNSSPNSENDRFFVQQMILYLWGSVLFTIPSRVVPAYLAYYVQNLEAIGNYNWAESIHSVLVKEFNFLKEYKEGKKVRDRYINGLCLAANVWFFEHVDFAMASRPSDPDVRPRMLKWVNVCKHLGRKDFLPRFREITEDKVSYHIPCKIADLELVSRDNECYMRSQIVGGSDNALRGEPSSQAKNLENIESDIQGGYKRTTERERHAEEENNRQKDPDSEVKHIVENLNNESKRVSLSLLARKFVKIEKLLVSKGCEIEEEIDDMNDLSEYKVGKDDEEVHDVKIDGKSCIEADKGRTMEGIGQPKLLENGVPKRHRRSGKEEVPKSTTTKKPRSGKKKGSNSSITKDHLPVMMEGDNEEEQVCIPTMNSSTRSRRKNVDILVYVDDDASPIELKKGWEIEEEINDIDDLTECKVGKGDEVVHDVKTDGKSCTELDKDRAMEGIGQPNLIENGVQKRRQQSVERKGPKSTTAKKPTSSKMKASNSTIPKMHSSVKRKRGVKEEQVCIPSMNSSTRSARKNVDILVNVDDYASPIKQKKKAKVAPLKYIGRELLSKKEREYLDAFCKKPMPTDEIVFFYWNIAIRRHSMVEYLRGGYTAEEIIDAYARILYESDEMSEDSVASFLYVPPMFLGLYHSKLGSYRTFLNSVDMKSLGKVKFLFLPFLVSTTNHWLLLVCDMKKRKWAVYDSLYDPRHREPAKKQIKLLAEYLHQDHEFDIRSWGLEYRRIYPQQEPGSLDCGVFVMKFIENIIRVPRKINFRGIDARLFRPQIAYKILCHC